MYAPLLIAALIALTPRTALCSKGRPQDASGWDHWYTVTVLPRTAYAYYHETLAQTKGRLHFKTEMWKREEGFINSEQLGVFSQDDPALTPLFYNFHANYRESEVSIDGTVANGRLQIRIRRNERELPLLARGLPGKAFFSSLFPVWMSRKLKDLPADQAQSQSIPFLAILEDNQDAGFPAESGRIRVAAPDEFSKSSSSTRVEVDFNGQRSSWYLDRNGAPLRIEMPGQKTRVDRVTEKQAKAFLNTP